MPGSALRELFDVDPGAVIRQVVYNDGDQTVMQLADRDGALHVLQVVGVGPFVRAVVDAVIDLGKQDAVLPGALVRADQRAGRVEIDGEQALLILELVGYIQREAADGIDRGGGGGHLGRVEEVGVAAVRGGHGVHHVGQHDRHAVGN